MPSPIPLALTVIAREWAIPPFQVEEMKARNYVNLPGSKGKAGSQIAFFSLFLKV